VERLRAAAGCWLLHLLRLLRLLRPCLPDELLPPAPPPPLCWQGMKERLKEMSQKLGLPGLPNMPGM
jgi:hypothetical protein